MSTFLGHRDLLVWQKAMELTATIYIMSERFPRIEQFGLTDQIRRAAVSVPSNIAEGHARQSTKEFVNFLSIARGSLAEIDTQIEIACRLGYVHEVNSVCDSIFELTKMLNSLMTSLRKKL